MSPFMDRPPICPRHHNLRYHIMWDREVGTSFDQERNMETSCQRELSSKWPCAFWGVWFCLTAFTGLVGAVSFFLQSGWNMAEFLRVRHACCGGAAGGCGISSSWRPASPHVSIGAAEIDQPLQIAVGPGDIFRTACFVLGVYWLVRASLPAGRLVVSGFWAQGLRRCQSWRSTRSDRLRSQWHLACLWRTQIAELLTNLRYDPDTIPAQRFSIAMLLIVITANCGHSRNCSHVGGGKRVTAMPDVNIHLNHPLAIFLLFMLFAAGLVVRPLTKTEQFRVTPAKLLAVTIATRHLLL